MGVENQTSFDEAGQRTEGERVAVNLRCDIRVGKASWHKADIADLTPGGFQVRIYEMPSRGTTVYVRIPGLQMLQAEVCWTSVDTAGCKFVTPLSCYTYDYIVQNARV